MASLEPAGSAGWWARLILEYDGSDFAGSQYQPRQRTVQGVVEEALERLTGEWRRIRLAGRTDTGVHASGQVASLIVPDRFSPVSLRRGLNALLPGDVAVLEAQQVAPGFHARYDARSRRYAYAIWNSQTRSPLRRRTTWQVREPLAVPAMQRAAAALIGDHDFASFAGAGHGVPDEGGQTRGTRRRVESVDIEIVDATIQGKLIHVEIEASAFLPHMVRNIVGALVVVGRGIWTAEQLQHVFAATDRRRSAPTAPPQGLCLIGVTYGAEWHAFPNRDDETTAQAPTTDSDNR